MSNIPAMLGDGCEVSHRVYCPQREAEALSAYAQCSRIPVEIFPGTVSAEKTAEAHAALSNPFIESIKREVLTVMAPCDHVFGEGLWRVIHNLIPGDYLVCGHPRVDYENGFVPMLEFLDKNPADENRQMVNLCMERIPHPMVSHGKIHPEPYWRTGKRADHWETFFAEPPPLAFWGRPELLEPWSKPTIFGAWEVIDHELPDHCLKRNTLRWVDDSRQFFWTEFTSNQIYLPTLYTGMNLDGIKHFHRTPLRWFFK